MAIPQTLRVRFTPETWRELIEDSATHDRAGASALAREILERWVAETTARRRSSDELAEAMAYLERRDGEWGDEPADFFDMPPA